MIVYYVLKTFVDDVTRQAFKHSLVQVVINGSVKRNKLMFMYVSLLVKKVEGAIKLEMIWHVLILKNNGN